jgi:hypothetical protein
MSRYCSAADDAYFLAGHFVSSLYNDDPSVELTFEASKLTIKYDNQTSVLKRGPNLNRPVAGLSLTRNRAIPPNYPLPVEHVDKFLT